MGKITPPLDEKTFRLTRRTVLLDYANYKEFIEDYIETFDIVTSQSLAERSTAPDCTAADLSAASSSRAWDAVLYIHVHYSGGLDILSLANFFPVAIEYWEEFAKYDKAYDQTAPYIVAHMPLGDDGYWDAIRMTCFAILLGRTDLLGRLSSIWDYGNQPLDGLLERLVTPYVPGRAPPPDECTRHLPYFKLLKVFAATPEKRADLMVKYMADWYVASRREPYYDSHTPGREHGFYGYWSFEAAAVSIVLDIDDAPYRDHEFYPRDLADFARSRKAGRLSGKGDTGEQRRPNLPAHQPCPEAGWWFTPALSGSRRYFKQGDIMPSVGGDYGLTFWQWSPDQSAPTL